MTERDPIVAAAEAWLAQDPDPATRAELHDLLQAATAGVAGAVADLTERFSGRLDFGTAGLRGELGAGPTRMNRVLVAQAAAVVVSHRVLRPSHEVAGPATTTDAAVSTRAAHADEHSIEVQLPFLQTVLGECASVKRRPCAASRPRCGVSTFASGL